MINTILCWLGHHDFLRTYNTKLCIHCDHVELRVGSWKGKTRWFRIDRKEVGS